MRARSGRHPAPWREKVSLAARLIPPGLESDARCETRVEGGRTDVRPVPQLGLTRCHAAVPLPTRAQQLEASEQPLRQNTRSIDPSLPVKRQSGEI